MLGRAGYADREGLCFCFAGWLVGQLMLDLGSFNWRVGNVESGAGRVEEMAKAGAGVEMVVSGMGLGAVAVYGLGDGEAGCLFGVGGERVCHCCVLVSCDGRCQVGKE